MTLIVIIAQRLRSSLIDESETGRRGFAGSPATLQLRRRFLFSIGAVPSNNES